MAQILKQFSSSQKFLGNLTALPHFGDLRREQAKRLISLVNKVSLTVSLCEPVLNALDDALWGEELSNELRSCLASRISETEDGCSKRKKQQDYCALPHYLTQGWWHRLEAAVNEEESLELLCNLAGRLGLRNPSEPTNGTLLTLAFLVGRNQPMKRDDQKELLKKHRSKMKTLLSKFDTPPVLMMALPLEVCECPPVLLRAAYPEGFEASTPLKISLREVFRLAAAFPLRDRDSAEKGKPAEASIDKVPETSELLSSFAASMVSKVLDKKASEALELQKATEEPRPVPLPKQLAIMDKPLEETPAPPKVGQKEVCESPGTIIAGFKRALQGQAGEAGGSNTSSFKRPAASLSEEMKQGDSERDEPSVLRKPAGKGQACKKPAGSLKRPAGKVGTSKKTADKPAGYMKMYPHGCAKCRWKPGCTPSCYRQRGEI
eukprot:Skav200328  [mRNA]  locus=scaffold1760:362249:363550:+ [translate_table: standard]